MCRRGWSSGCVAGDVVIDHAQGLGVEHADLIDEVLQAAAGGGVAVMGHGINAAVHGRSANGLRKIIQRMLSGEFHDQAALPRLVGMERRQFLQSCFCSGTLLGMRRRKAQPAPFISLKVCTK